MKFGAAFLLVSTLLAVGYGVLFQNVYPLVEIDNGVVTLCALAGLITALAAVGLWKLVARVKTP
ncbi:hypothetical protein [Rhodopseudomonas palustris]|uniref:hypothetical protein n=1 Tax=Rhodopseudomonas palustris TaxID=1076 RepID=UPI00005DA137